MSKRKSCTFDQPDEPTFRPPKKAKAAKIKDSDRPITERKEGMGPNEPPKKCRCKTGCKNGCVCIKAGVGCGPSCGCSSCQGDTKCQNRMNDIAKGLAAEGLRATSCFAAYVQQLYKRPIDFKRIEELMIWHIKLVIADHDDWLREWLEERDKLTENELPEHLKKAMRYGFFLNQDEKSKYYLSFCNHRIYSVDRPWRLSEREWHCPVCKDCTSWRYWHCSKCQKCKFGVNVPCDGCGGVSKIYYELPENKRLGVDFGVDEVRNDQSQSSESNIDEDCGSSEGDLGEEHFEDTLYNVPEVCRDIPGWVQDVQRQMFP